MDYVSVSKVTVDPRLDCLVLLTEHFGSPCSSESLTAGLPLNSANITPDLLPQAASRAGLAAKMSRKDLDQTVFFNNVRHIIAKHSVT
jgi:ATP-binding cassette subfamily C protein LapB